MPASSYCYYLIRLQYSDVPPAKSDVSWARPCG